MEELNINNHMIDLFNQISFIYKQSNSQENENLLIEIIKLVFHITKLLA